MLEESARRQYPCSSRDKLDGERQPVHAPTDLVRRADVPVVPDDVRTNGGNALHEERRRTREWGDRVRVLPLQSKRLAAGREHLESAARLQQPGDERSRGEQMLEVVEHEQKLQIPDASSETKLLIRPERREADSFGDRRRHEIRVCEPVERDVCRTVGKSRSEPASNLKGEARLADAAGPRQSHESHVAALQQPQELAELVVAPDERGRASR